MIRIRNIIDDATCSKTEHLKNNNSQNIILVMKKDWEIYVEKLNKAFEHFSSTKNILDPSFTHVKNKKSFKYWDKTSFCYKRKGSLFLGYIQMLFLKIYHCVLNFVVQN